MSRHDGQRVRGISKVNPGRDGISLASFQQDNQGVHYVSYPAALAARASVVGH
jgi:hypothetical protein